MASHDQVSSLDFQYLNMKRASDGLTDLNIKCPSYRLTDAYSNTKHPSEQIPYVYQTSV